MANKFDWKATESAPKKYPMEIVEGHFYAPDGYSLYVPNKKTIHHGWGRGVSSHLVGSDLKSLPNRLEITFFSYTEDEFYHGNFNLPYETILKLFNDGYYSAKNAENVTYFEIVAGVSPGGLVSVWLAGIDKTTEVYSGKATKTNIDWKRIIDNPNISRSDFIEESINHSRSIEEQKMLEKKIVPIDLWDSYRKRYNWQPLFTGQEPPELITRVRYYNGEDEYLFYPLQEDFTRQSHSIPKRIVFIWEWPIGRKLVFEIDFDEEEIFAAFNKLSKENLPMYLTFHMEDTDSSRGFWIVLKNDKNHIVLKKSKLENYGV